MQLTINKTHEDELKYPYVAKLQDTEHLTVVLFTDHTEGVCLMSTDSRNTIGETSYNWKEELFKPCSVTLS